MDCNTTPVMPVEAKTAFQLQMAASSSGDANNIPVIPIEVKPNEDTGRGETWSEADTRHLISVWADSSIQRQLRGLFRNNTVYDEICRRLRVYGVHRTPAQCRNKTKNLRKGFRELKLRSGRCSKSITRQSSIFYKELDKVWGQDFLNNPREFESQEAPPSMSTELKETDESAEMYDNCVLDASNMSDNDPRDYEPRHSHEDLSEEPNEFSDHDGFVYATQPEGYTPTGRHKMESMVEALQQVGHESMERIKETVMDLNRSFLEQQFAAEERREKQSKEHEIRLLEMFMTINGKDRQPSQETVYPVKISQSMGQFYSNHTQSSAGRTRPSSSKAVQDAEGNMECQDNVRLSNRASSISSCPSSMKCLVLRLHPGDDITDCLKKLMDDKSILAACIVSCVGSVKCAELRMADSKTIKKLATNHEIVSLVGTLAKSGMHLHASLSDNEGKVIGGHVMGNMKVFTTAEIVIGQLPGVVFKREMDSSTGYKELEVTPGQMS
ncbi:uncharacterized protein [Asterias amurensis]|uniref:uncharacterized protein n=1 Tax=Asterias amurensis TaxID=7602 RepID=UPI003AB6F588